MNRRVEVVHAVGDIGESAWNELVPADGYYSSYRWIAGHESLPGLRSAYVCVREGTGLVAVAPVSFAKRELSAEYDQARFREIFADTASYAVLGPRRGYRNSWLIRRSSAGEDRAALVGEIAAAALDVAAGWHVEAVVVPYLPEPASAWLADERLVRQRCAVDAEAVIELGGGTFEGYLGTLPKKRRNSVRRERAELGRHGLRTAVEPAGASLVEAVAELMSQVERKYGRAVTVRGLHRYLESTFTSDPHARLFTCRTEGGELVSATLAYEWASGLFVKATATDYAAVPPGSFAHFNTSYYEPIDYCLARGLTSVHLGIGAMATKLARGFRAEPLHHLLLRR
jgi:predicted N-acyltransferase